MPKDKKVGAEPAGDKFSNYNPGGKVIHDPGLGTQNADKGNPKMRG